MVDKKKLGEWCEFIDAESLNPAKIRFWRNGLGLTIKDAAFILRMPYRTYHNYELGCRPIPKVLALAMLYVSDNFNQYDSFPWRD